MKGSCSTATASVLVGTETNGVQCLSRQQRARREIHHETILSRMNNMQQSLRLLFLAIAVSSQMCFFSVEIADFSEQSLE